MYKRQIWNVLQELGHRIVPAVPSLFTFNTKDERIKGLAGIATEAHVTIKGSKLKSNGPLLITHWGFSGPAILKISAWGALELNACQYHFDCIINWIPYHSTEEIVDSLVELKHKFPKQHPATYAQFDLPKRLWQRLVLASGIMETIRWADINKKQLQELARQLTQCTFTIKGKSTFKEEFVTAGGIDLKEVNFKTYESKKFPNLYFAGEVMNIDAITGGFNFQNAWTGGYIAAKAISSSYI